MGVSDLVSGPIAINEDDRAWIILTGHLAQNAQKGRDPYATRHQGDASTFAALDRQVSMRTTQIGPRAKADLPNLVRKVPQFLDEKRNTGAVSGS